MWAEGFSLAFIVSLLAWMFFFTASSLPLLILKHDVPQDATFICCFFDVQNLGLLGLVPRGIVSSIIAGRFRIALGMVCLALIGFAARREVIARMDPSRAIMTATAASEIRKFRSVHGGAIVLNICLLAGFALTIALASAELAPR